MKYSFNDTMELAKKEYGLGKGDYFKPKDGDNRIRVVSAAIPYQSEYKNQVRVQFVCWVIDRADNNKIKLYFMPVRIFEAIAALQQDEDYAFEDVPMPYDINIKTIGAGTREVKYQVLPRPKTELTKTEATELAELKDVEEVVAKLKEGQKSSSGSESEAIEDSSGQPDTGEEVGEEVPF